jgi:hypothetical protein
MEPNFDQNKIDEMSNINDVETYDDNHNDISNWLEEKLTAIERIDDSYLQMLSMYSLLEAFSQEYDGYKATRSFDPFERFVLEFSGEVNTFLSKYDPVSLFYKCEDLLKKYFDLNFLGQFDSATIDDAILQGRADEMVSAIRRNAALTEGQLKYHTFVGMLYRQRNKLSHEHFCVSMSPRFESYNDDTTPRYMKVIYGDVRDGRIASKDIWQFDFPLGYVKGLLKTCVANYLAIFSDKRTTREQLIPWCNRPIKFDNYRNIESR